MGLRQSFTGLVEPTDPLWRSAPSAARKTYYDAAGMIVLDELAKQLQKGIGRSGRAMKVRKQPVLRDGADGPVMIPHWTASRAITLADYMATDHSLTLFWHAGTGHASFRKSRNPTPFGDILQFHADGLVSHAPVRDVRLSKARLNNVRVRLRATWESLRKGFAPPPPAPKAAPKPKAKAKARPGPLPKGVPVLTRLPLGRTKGPYLLDTKALRGQPPPKPPPAPGPRPAPRPGPRPPAPASRPSGEAVHEGLAFARDAAATRNGHRIVTADVAALERHFAADRNDHIAPGGTGPSARVGSYAEAIAQIQRALATGKPVAMPRVYVDVFGHVSFGDGRHRFAALRDLGFMRIAVSTPAGDAARVGKLVGPTPAGPVRGPEDF